MDQLQNLRQSYALRDLDHDFAVGRRSNLRYAVASKSLSFTKLNEKGPEPLDYLAYAKTDLSAGDQRGKINALGNAKRSIHLVVDQLMFAWGLQKAYKKTEFPDKLAILKNLDAFPTRMITDLNHARNLMEHDFEDIGDDDVSKFVEIAEMFLLLTYPYFREIITGIYVGLVDDNRCLEWTIEQKEANLSIYEVEAPIWIDSAVGRIHYNIGDKNDRTLLKTIQISRPNEEGWLRYLDLFVYYTKREVTRLELPDEQNGRIHRCSHSLHAFDLQDGD